MQLFKDDGLYIPSFFLLHVNNREQYDRILLHELIHFLQDISTTFGLINISHNVNKIKDFNQIIRNSSILDSNTQKSRSDIHKTNDDLFSYYIGDGAEKITDFNPNIRILDIKIEPSGLDDYQIDEIYIIIGNDAIKGQAFHFGAMAIMESMAYIIECYVYGKESKFKRYPYDSVSMIVEHIIPSLNNPLDVSELCEASLMFYHPAEVLIAILQIMKKEKFHPNKNGDTYNFVLSNMKFDTEQGPVNILKHFYELAKDAASQLDDLITVEPFKSEQLGRRYIEKSCNLLRLTQNISITSLFYDLNSYPNYFQDVMTEIGLPLIIDADYNAMTHKDMESLYSPFFFPAIYSIFNILRIKTKECQLHEFCSKNREQMKYDDRCIHAPWTRVLDNELCPFSHIWKMWGLENITVATLEL